MNKLCEYCSCDAQFVHDGSDPIYMKGVWEKNRIEHICIKRMTITEQNNKGKYMICDTKKIKTCHFYKERR